MTAAAARALVFHPGTQHSWQTAMALDDLDRLVFYATSIFYQPDRMPYSLARHLPARWRAQAEREFRRFEQPGLDPAMVRTAGLDEWLERIASRGGWPKLAAWLDRNGNRRFGRSIVRTLDRPDRFALWGYSGSAETAFAAAKLRGRPCILDRTIGDWRAYNALMDDQFARFPDCFASPAYRVDDATIANDDREYALADVILTGSAACADTVRQHASAPGAASRVRVLPYCYDARLFGGLPAPTPRRDGPVEFLFLGQASVRKGFHLLLRAFARIPASAARLTVVGAMTLPPAIFARHADRITYRPTVPRSDVPALMMATDVLMLPSFFEGSAITLIEALASGAALIQSRAAGTGVTPDTGLMLDEVTEDGLYAAMMTAIEDRERLAHWRMEAQPTARLYDFARYRAGVDAVMAEID